MESVRGHDVTLLHRLASSGYYTRRSMVVFKHYELSHLPDRDASRHI